MSRPVGRFARSPVRAQMNRPASETVAQLAANFAGRLAFFEKRATDIRMRNHFVWIARFLFRTKSGRNQQMGAIRIFFTLRLTSALRLMFTLQADLSRGNSSKTENMTRPGVWQV